MRLFGLVHRAPEQPRLRIMVGEAFRADAQLRPALLGGKALEAVRVFARATGFAGEMQAVRLVIGAALGHLHLHMPVALHVQERAARRIGAALGLVDRQLVPVGRAQPLDLRVLIAEQPPLQQRIVRMVDPRHHVAGAEGDLLGLGEEIVGIAVEHQLADDANRQHLLGDDLGRVEHVIRLAVREFLVEQLHAQIPFGIVAAVDPLEQVASLEVGIGAGDLDRLVPDRRGEPRARLPVKLDEGAFPLGIDEAEGMDAEPLHRGEAARQRAIRHRPHDHMGRLGHQRDEVPEGVVRGRRLWIAAIGLHLGGVDQVGELHRVLDEEHRDVVADQVPIALARVELHRKAAHVARRVDRPGAASDRGEAHEHLGALALLLEQVGAGDVGQ